MSSRRDRDRDRDRDLDVFGETTLASVVLSAVCCSSATESSSNNLCRLPQCDTTTTTSTSTSSSAMMRRVVDGVGNMSIMTPPGRNRNRRRRRRRWRHSDEDGGGNRRSDGRGGREDHDDDDDDDIGRYARCHSTPELGGAIIVDGNDDGSSSSERRRRRRRRPFSSDPLLADHNDNASSSSLTPPTPKTTEQDGGDHRSPAMELSAARQVANRTQMSNARVNARESLRSYARSSHDGARDPAQTTPTRRYSATKNSADGRTTTLASASASPSSPSSENGSADLAVVEIRTVSSTTIDDGARGERRARVVTARTPSREVYRGESDDGTTTMTTTPASTPPSTGDGSAGQVAMAVVVERPRSCCFEDAPPAPTWPTVSSGGIVHSELASTYRFPRLYLRDPSAIIETQTTNNDDDDDGDMGSWWFRLAQRTETTLKHVQYHHWKASPAERQRQQRQQQQQQHRTNGNCSCPTTPEDKRQRQRRRRSNNPSEGPSTSAPVDAWSEPHASTIKVRGGTYLADGVKEGSGPSLFSVVGVDSFVREGCCGKAVNNNNNNNHGAGRGGGNVVGIGGDDDGDVDDDADSFRANWIRDCGEVGLDPPPFLLIFNFIVPWGNFKAYLIRPDADDGPFSTRCEHAPSERAWRDFMEGTTEYRNKRLKLIPRVCAGPWMVKKMVGSTPAIIGAKLPVSYRGSVHENYLEVEMNVAAGPAFGNSVANTVAGKADVVTVDLGFVIEGKEEAHLPERMLGMVRVHHLDMKGAPSHAEWKEELLSWERRC